MSNKPDLSSSHLENLSRLEGEKSVAAMKGAAIAAATGAAETILFGGGAAAAAVKSSVPGVVIALGHADAAQELQKQADISRMCKDPNDPHERLRNSALYNSVFDHY